MNECNCFNYISLSFSNFYYQKNSQNYFFSLFYFYKKLLKILNFIFIFIKKNKKFRCKNSRDKNREIKA